MRRSFVRAALLGLAFIVTLPPLIVLCRGRSPSRFSPANLPVWERKAPRPAQVKGQLRARPLPPRAVQFDASLIQSLIHTNENRLLAQIESPPRHPTLAAGDAGLWLEAACALGRQNRTLAAKQDRVALRLMTAEDADGYLAAGQGRARWTAAQAQAESRNLRGLLASYAVTGRAAIIYAAMQAGDLVVSEPELGGPAVHPRALPFGSVKPRKKFIPPTASLVLPLTRLYLMTRQARYLQWAAHQAKTGHTDSAGLCALYMATGRSGFLHQAQILWKRSVIHGKTDPLAASCLLAVTGGPGYAQALQGRPAPWPCPLMAGSMAFTQTPQGLTINIWTSARVFWKGAYWIQTAAKLPSGLLQTTLIVNAQQPVSASLAFPVAGKTVTANINGKPLPASPGLAALTMRRVWRTGDRLTLAMLPAAPPARNLSLPVISPPGLPPLPAQRKHR